jgi:thiamine-phosphate pyrophosphorylase
MKDASIDEMRPIAIEAQRLCKEASATFIIDDNVALVKEIGADGVHLGKKDMPVDEARHILGDGFIIGGTANTFEDVKGLYLSDADYVGCGPFRFTTTKKGLSPILGLDGYRFIVSRMREEDIDIPVVAIGGITAEDIPKILDTGISGIALSGTVLRSDEPVEEMRKLIDLEASKAII